MLVDFEGSI